MTLFGNDASSEGSIAGVDVSEVVENNHDLYASWWQTAE